MTLPITSTNCHSIIAEAPMHHCIQDYFGDSISLIDAESWLAGIDGLTISGHRQVADLTLSNLLAVAAVQGSDLAEKLEAMAVDLHLPFRSFQEPSCSSFTKWIVEMALSHATEASRDAAISRHAASILRQDLDSQQQAFEALEAAVQDFGMPQFTLACDLPVGTERLILAGDECAIQESTDHPIASGQLTQLLPISARRIASIDLCCEPLAECPRTGSLTVSILDLLGNQLGSSNEIDVADLAFGWNRFSLPAGIDCSDRDAVLRLRLKGPGAVRLKLGLPVPISRFHPLDGRSCPIGDAPVAIKVWRGFAGVRAAVSHVRLSEGGIIRHRPGCLPPARLLTTDDPSMGFEPVQYWAKEDAFLVHPPAAGMTVGVIKNLELDNLNAITAIINNNHREGPIISFAIGIVPSDSLFHVPDVLGDWLKLPPLGWGEVHVQLAEPTSGRFDLILATMVSTEQGNHMAWGLFRDFILNTLAK